jgi:hypothetical protein
MVSEPGSTMNLRLLPEDEELKRRYLLWCEGTWGGGDCLRLLVDKPFLDGDAKYALAMAIAHSRVLGAMKEELARMVSPQAVVATVVGGLTMYAILLALPEPVSKGIAALMTLGAMAYLGWDTVRLCVCFFHIVLFRIFSIAMIGRPNHPSRNRTTGQPSAIEP